MIVLLEYFTTALSFTSKKVAIQSIRAAFYEFVKCAPHLVIDGVEAGYALDVSFGTSGFTLALARAFEKVCS